MKDIKGYEGLYAVTEDGQVWSYRSNKFLKQRKDKDGYLLINLSVSGIIKTFKVHRLVAEAYIPNPDLKETVNHKDENKVNNNVSNLEWMTREENSVYGTKIDRIKKSIYCIELNKTYASITEAANEFNLNKGNLCTCLKGKQKTFAGYHWRYIDE